MLRTLRAGYDRKSLVALAVLLAVYGAVALIWRDFIDLSRGMDWFLAVTWTLMTAVLCWGISPRRDLIRVSVGLGGGLVIEAWGTATNLWSYYTHERPPVWIIPAWPVASLAIDRLSRAIGIVMPERAGGAAVPVLGLFVVLMTMFVAPTAHIPATMAALTFMVVLVAWSAQVRRGREDLCLFLAGAFLGIFLERWGTSRWCWRYYTHEEPPIEAVLAHGLAAVAFQRGAEVVERMLARLSALGPARTWLRVAPTRRSA